MVERNDPGVGDRPSAVVNAVRSRLDEFVEAFRNLELEPFMALWGDNPSVFHPFAHASERLTGRDAVRARWEAIFDGVRNSHSGPPYLELNARDVDIRPVGSDVAVVTFHLHVPRGVGRRFLVFERQHGEWRIVHLHASNLTRVE